MNNEILEQLKELALSRSIPFCYSCYKEAPTGCCKTCGSDDLMRLVPEVGCEYGTDWVIKHILETELILQSIQQTIQSKFKVNIVNVCNDLFAQYMSELREIAGSTTEECKSRVMRVFQIEEKLSRHLERVEKQKQRQTK